MVPLAFANRVLGNTLDCTVVRLILPSMLVLGSQDHISVVGQISCFRVFISRFLVPIRVVSGEPPQQVEGFTPDLLGKIISVSCGD
jgi:hypothetical protein